jgi:hypothetical protein
MRRPSNDTMSRLLNELATVPPRQGKPNATAPSQSTPPIRPVFSPFDLRRKPLAPPGRNNPRPDAESSLPGFRQ